MGVMSKVARGLPELANRGYQVLFRQNESNHCPGCGHAQWYVGRVTAECFFCGTALPLADAKWAGGSGTTHRFGLGPTASTDWSERRQHARRPGRGRVLRLLVDGSPQAFAVHNISTGGAMIGGTEALSPKASIELVAPSGEIVPAEIRWSEDGKAGLRFAKPVASAASPKNSAD